MTGTGPGRTGMVGRRGELGRLREGLDGALRGGGGAVLVHGEPGIGKTRLLDEFAADARGRGALVLRGSAKAGTVSPMAVFTEAFGSRATVPLFQREESVAFTEVLAVDGAGELVARAGKASERNFAGMLTAVQSFSRDSIGEGQGNGSGIGRLDYGGMKIIIEHGGELFVAAVFEGTEHARMRAELKSAVRGMERGRMTDSSFKDAVASRLEGLMGARFTVKRELEGVRLENERVRFAESVLQELARVSEPNGAVLIIEDLHWADETSLSVLTHLSRNVRDRRVLVVGTYRSAEGAPLAGALRKMREGGRVADLALERLDGGAVRALVSEAYPSNAFPDAFVARLADECGGNPLFVLELLSQMEADGKIAAEGGRRVLAGEDYTIPDTVEAMVWRRLENLDADAMAMAEYASCVGRDFPVSEALSIRSIQDPAAALGRLASSGILVRDNGSARFSHALFQEAVYDGISQTWRGAHHRSIGEHIEAAHADEMDAVAYDLARHFGRSEDRAKSLKYNLMAGEKADAALAADLAVGFFATALGAIGHGGPAPAGLAEELGERIGDLESLLGRFDGALASYGAAIARVAEPEAGARLHRKRGMVYHKRGKMDLSLKEFESAMARLGGMECLEGARVLSAIGLVQEGKGDFARALETQKRAEAMYEARGAAVKDLSYLVMRIGACHHQMGDFDEAMLQYKRALEYGRESNDQMRIASALNNIGIINAIQGRYDEALACSLESLGIREKAGDVYSLARLHNNIGVILADREDFEGAEFHYRQYLAISKKLGDVWGEGSALNNIGTMLTNKGENDKAIGYQEEALKLMERVGDKNTLAYCHLGLGHALLEKSSLDAAEGNFSKAVALANEAGARELEGRAVKMMADASSQRGNWASAKELYERALAIMRETGAARGVPEVLMAYGVMLKANGDAAGARTRLVEARDLYGKMGVRCAAARAEKHLDGL